jgi:outer membrane immunogenic protein
MRPMKKFCTLTVTVFASIGLAQVVFAGPEPTGKEMKQVAPAPPPPCPSWTGFYIGGFGAFDEAEIDTHLDLTGEWEEFPEAERNLQRRGERTRSVSGGEAGGLLGYNYQFGGNWVIGAEADGGYLWERNSNSVEFEDSALERDVKISGSFKTHYLFTFGGKVGYALCNWLPYVTGGLAVGDTDFNGQVVVRDFRDEEDLRFQHNNTQSRAGWFVGGGLEYRLTNHWRLRAQYQYIDLGSEGFTRQDNLGEGFISHRSIDLREHNAQFAIIYGF